MNAPQPIATDVDIDIDIDVSADSAAALTSLGGSRIVGRAGVNLVEVLTADENRARSSQAFVRSAVGDRLRVSALTPADESRRRVLVQRDTETGLEATTVLEAAGAAVRIRTTVMNASTKTVVLTGVNSVNVGIGHGEQLGGLVLHTAASTWLSESRWRAQKMDEVIPPLDLALHGQDGRGAWSLSSHGSWSTGEHLPFGVIVDEESGDAMGWQIESGAGWHVDLTQTRSGAVLSLSGPLESENQFAHALAPGASFDAAPVTLAVSPEGFDGVVKELTAHRRARRGDAAVRHGLPIVYNDFMNTLMGEPSTEALRPLIAEAAAAGVEIFCIDAGWFADPREGDWWATVGEWTAADSRFSAGLAPLIEEIHAHGMRSGLWLEPEVVGRFSPVADLLPRDAFFHRYGTRVNEANRFHLDFRHPAAREHLDTTVDRLVAEYGISYLKLDYNINPGAGTDIDATGPGDGLLGHARAYRSWLEQVQLRHPDLILENCSSGAMRAEPHLLEATHLQSTSDQQDHLLYPPIAASSPVSILPEQCGNWAYPAAGMSLDETTLTLVTGLSGRLYLSGFLNELSAEQRDLTHEAVRAHKNLRDLLPTSVPFWPLGLPSWDDDTICLGLHTASGDLVFLWDRGPHRTEIRIPALVGDVEQVFPRRDSGWDIACDATGLSVRTSNAVGARVLLITPSEDMR